MKRILLPFILFTFLFSIHGVAQPPKSEVKRGIKTIYYNQSDTVHAKGRIRSGSREGVWNWYAYTPTGQQYIYESITYVAGMKEGPSFKIEGEFIKKGNNLTEKPHGNYEQYTFTVSTMGDTVRTPHTFGEFNQGTKVGDWKFFDAGKLKEEGRFLAGKRSGSWREYNTRADGKELMVVTKYNGGLKDGQQIMHFEMLQEETDCPTGQTAPCYKYTRFEQYSEITWQNDVKHGPYLIKDKDGFEIEKGNYFNGKKDGEVMTFDRETKTFLYSNYMDGEQSGPATYKDKNEVITIKGGFLKGARNGKWTWVKSNGDPIKEVNYEAGVVNGKVKMFMSSGLVQESMKVENDFPKEVLRYDASGSNVAEEFQLTANTPEEGMVAINHTTTEGSLVITYNYHWKPEAAVTWDNFNDTYKDARFSQKDFYSDGMYSKVENDVYVEHGNFTKGLRDGVWDLQYNKTVLWKVTYTKGEKTGEEFLDAKTKAPFKGNFLVTFENGKTRYDFKIKDGKRNGKSLTYDEDGMLLLEEKFKDGALIE